MVRGIQQEPSPRPTKKIRSSSRSAKAPIHADGTRVQDFSSKPAAAVVATKHSSSCRVAKALLNHDGTTKKNYSGLVANTQAASLPDTAYLKQKKEREHKAEDEEEAKQRKAEEDEKKQQQRKA
jgi:hypothetical protein